MCIGSMNQKEIVQHGFALMPATCHIPATIHDKQQHGCIQLIQICVLLWIHKAGLCLIDWTSRRFLVNFCSMSTSRSCRGRPSNPWVPKSECLLFSCTWKYELKIEKNELGNKVHSHASHHCYRPRSYYCVWGFARCSSHLLELSLKVFEAELRVPKWCRSDLSYFWKKSTTHVSISEPRIWASFDFTMCTAVITTIMIAIRVIVRTIIAITRIITTIVRRRMVIIIIITFAPHSAASEGIS